MAEPKCDVCGDLCYYPIHNRFGTEVYKIACPECKSAGHATPEDISDDQPITFGR